MSHSEPSTSSSSPKSALNIIFAGTPEFASKHLQALIDSPHNILAVYTQPDRPAGRGKKLSASPVKILAEKNALNVCQPKSLRDISAQEELRQFNPDLMIVVAYGLILPQAVLDIPVLGCINVHASILPRWRGAAPIQRAIEAGDTKTGVTIMQMDEGLDTGDMLLKAECLIDKDENAGQLHDKLCSIGPPALLQSLEQLMNGSLLAEKQNDASSNYAKKIEKIEAQINWQESALDICRKIRAFNPFPICFATINGERIRILQAQEGPSHDLSNSHSYDPTQEKNTPGRYVITKTDIIVTCGKGYITLQKIQLPGKKAVPVKDFLNGSLSILERGYFDSLDN